MPIYTHGGDIYAQSGPVLDFSANQNPLGMPPAVAEAAQAAVLDAQRYPDSLCRALRRAISRRDGVPAEWICCGNGAADVIFRLCLALRSRQALVTAPTFSEYAQAVEAAGGEVVRYPLARERGFAVDEGFAAALSDGVELAFLCSPNNPTGRRTAQPVLEEILRRAEEQKVWLVVDECFLHLCDGGGEGLVRRLSEFPRLVLLRAFTKCYAMPGLRLGYCLTAHPELPGRLYQVGQPWSVSAPAQAAGIAACACPGWPEEAMERVIRPQRARLTAALRALGLTVWESETNYLLFSASGRDDLKERLLARGVLIRSCANYPGLGACDYRIAVRLPEENDILLNALKEVLE